MAIFSETALAIEVGHYLCYLYPSDPAAGPTRVLLFTLVVTRNLAHALQTQDSVLSGHLVLTLSRPRKVQRILVEFYGKQHINLSGIDHDYETIRLSLTINPFEQYGELPSGEHRFAFAFVIPANTAPFDFCAWGRTQHYLVATAVGCGAFRSDVVASQEISLMANMAPPGQSVPGGFDQISEAVHDTLGPYRVHFYSKYLMRGGYLRLALSMPAIFKAVTLVDIQIVLRQKTVISYPPKPHKLEHKSTDIVLWSYREEEGMMPQMLAGGQELSVIRHVRLIGVTDRHCATEPQVVRPTTSAYSETGIRMQHSVTVKVRFTPTETELQETREVEITFPATIASCACSIQNAQLPGYSASTEAESSTQVSATIHDWRKRCLCRRPADNELKSLYGVDPKGMFLDDQYGVERDRRPPWMDKAAEDAAGDAADGA